MFSVKLRGASGGRIHGVGLEGDKKMAGKITRREEATRYQAQYLA